MLLGKRSRPPMKRTTSLSDITFDFDFNPSSSSSSSSSSAEDEAHPHICTQKQQQQLLNSRFLTATTISPRTHRRGSGDFLETAPFLKSCSLCHRRLIPSRDIFMYRGDSAFCSQECRQQQMNHDERQEKCSLASKKQVMMAASANSSATASDVSSTTGESIAAV